MLTHVSRSSVLASRMVLVRLVRTYPGLRRADRQNALLNHRPRHMSPTKCS